MQSSASLQPKCKCRDISLISFGIRADTWAKTRDMLLNERKMEVYISTRTSKAQKQFSSTQDITRTSQYAEAWKGEKEDLETTQGNTLRYVEAR